MQISGDILSGASDAVVGALITGILWMGKRLRRALKDIDYAHRNLRIERRRRIKLKKQLIAFIKSQVR